MQTASNPHQPIGIYDSGVGGLSVLRAIRAALPHEDLLYLGDQANVPYGERTLEDLRELARGDERTVRLGDHKNTIEGKSAHVCQCVRNANAAHGFHRMNKKPG